MSKVIVIGGGAAGMMAAISASGKGKEVHLLEKNEKLGKKIFITGKGRCNLTNACDVDELFEAMLSDYRFLYSGFYKFSNHQTMSFFEDCGVPLKIERGNRVFPVSDRSSDIINALRSKMREKGVKVHLNTEVEELLYQCELESGNKDGYEDIFGDGNEDECKYKNAGRLKNKNRENNKNRKRIKGVKLTDGNDVLGDICIVATGGLAYPSTGSTGDGYRFAREIGHKITRLYPGLVPIETKEDYVKQLQGLSLRNVGIRVIGNESILYEAFGEMLFTHYGVSGPIILSASSVVGGKLRESELTVEIDLKPALTLEQLNQRVLREFSDSTNRQFKNAIGKLFPSKLVPVIINLSKIDGAKPANVITREERQGFVKLIKAFPLTITRLRPFDEAIITKGGVELDDINPSTMESRLAKNLYFAGEVLDLDAVTGGFNLQIAWSTGYLAGESSGRVL